VQKKKEQSIEEPYGELGHAMNFTYGDLQANQAGFLSHRQVELVRQKKMQSFRGYLSASVIFALIGLLPVLYIFMAPNPKFTTMSSVGLVAFMILFFACLSIVLAMFAFDMFKSSQDKDKNQRIKKLRVIKSRQRIILEAVDFDYSFSVPYPVYKLIEHEQLYCLYFYDFDGMGAGLCLYSIEPIYGQSPQVSAGHDSANYEVNERAKEKRTI
jgi:hypothetical protein